MLSYIFEDLKEELFGNLFNYSRCLKKDYFDRMNYVTFTPHSLKNKELAQEITKELGTTTK